MKQLTEEFHLTFGWAIAILIIVGIGIVYSNLAGLVSTLGLGVVSFAGRASELKQSWVGHIEGKGRLERPRGELQMKLERRSHSDDACLDGVCAKMDENIVDFEKKLRRGRASDKGPS